MTRTEMARRFKTVSLHLALPMAGEKPLLQVWYPSQSFVTLVTKVCYNYRVNFSPRIARRAGAEFGLS